MARIKPRLQQINLAKLTLQNPHLIKHGKKKELVALGGYGESVQHTPAKVLESRGYLEALDDLGLTDELLTTSLVEDIKAKPKNRKPELELGFKVRGRLKNDEPNGPIFNFNILTIEQQKRVARRVIAGDK